MSLSVLQPPALQKAALHEPHCEAAPFPLRELPGDRISGQHPSVRRAAGILHFVTLTGGFELVDRVKETVDNSLKLKRKNGEQGKLFCVLVKTRT